MLDITFLLIFHWKFQALKDFVSSILFDAFLLSFKPNRLTWIFFNSLLLWFTREIYGQITYCSSSMTKYIFFVYYNFRISRNYVLRKCIDYFSGKLDFTSKNINIVYVLEYFNELDLDFFFSKIIFTHFEMKYNVLRWIIKGI